MATPSDLPIVQLTDRYRLMRESLYRKAEKAKMASNDLAIRCNRLLRDIKNENKKIDRNIKWTVIGTSAFIMIVFFFKITAISKQYRLF